MNILIHAGEDYARRWQKALHDRDPAIGAFLLSEDPDPASLDCLLSFDPPAGLLPRMTNLKFIQCPGAGVDQIFRNPEVKNISVARIVDLDQALDLAVYALSVTMAWYRKLDAYAEQQSRKVWDRLFPHPRTRDLTVGILGAGVMGSAVRSAFEGIGVRYLTWRRTVVAGAGDTFSGRTGLVEMAGRVQAIVNTLPLTPETRGILDEGLFQAMPRGGFVLNIGRGAHVVEADLLAAIGNGQLSGAALDVFESEPLPEESALWSCDRLRVTPHIGAFAAPESAAGQIVESLKRVRRGEPPLHLCDAARGY